MNLVVDLPSLSYAVGGLTGGRFLFMVPWRAVSIAGTSHGPAPSEGGAVAINERHVEAFLAEVRAAFPHANLTRDKIRLVHRGLLPAPAGSRDGLTLIKESLIHDHAAEGFKGLLTVVGARYTTAGATARAVAARVDRAAGQNPARCLPASGFLPLTWAIWSSSRGTRYRRPGPTRRWCAA